MPYCLFLNYDRNIIYIKYITFDKLKTLDKYLCAFISRLFYYQSFVKSG